MKKIVCIVIATLLYAGLSIAAEKSKVYSDGDLKRYNYGDVADKRAQQMIRESQRGQAMNRSKEKVKLYQRMQDNWGKDESKENRCADIKRQLRELEVIKDTDPSDQLARNSLVSLREAYRWECRKYIRE